MKKYETGAGIKHVQADELRRLIKIGERARDLDLTGMKLVGEDLSDLGADRLYLQEADLRCARFCAARLGSCHFQHAHIEESDWSNATARVCVLDDALASGARFDGARLEDSSAKGADFTRASLRGTRLTETSFERAVLREARLDEAQGDGVGFRGADLSGARLVGAKLDEADFRGADLRGADLSNGRFHSADFRGAILDDTVFAGADLEGALFDKDYDRGFDATTGAVDDLQDSDDALLAAMQKALSGLPGESADYSPDELTRWLDLLVKMAMSEKAPGAEEMLDGVRDRPTELKGAQSQWGDLPPEMRGLLETMVPIVLKALRAAERRGDIDSEMAERLIEDAIRYQGASPPNAPSSDTLEAASRVLGDLGDDVLPKLLGALWQKNGGEPPPEVKDMILRLREELSLDETATAEDVLSQLMSRLGHSSR